MRKKISNMAESESALTRFGARIENARKVYMEDPWNAAYGMPDDLLDYFPEARKFRQGRLLLYLLCLDCSHRDGRNLDDFFEEYVPEFSLYARKRIVRAVREYYAARGDVSAELNYNERNFTLPEIVQRNQSKMSKHIGLEIEVDDGSSDHAGLRDGFHEIRTGPTKDKHSLMRFLSSIQNILFILHDLGLIPLGYELSVHVNIDVGQDLLMLSKPGAELGLFIKQICIPNISQARLERCMELGFTSRNPLSFRFGSSLSTPDKRNMSICVDRLHMHMFEVSPTCDLNYFIFACEIIGRAINETFLSYAIDVVERSYKAHNLFFKLFGSYEDSFNGNFLLGLPWLKYHELMYGLRRKILSVFGSEIHEVK